MIPELRDLSYEERLKECGLTTLQTRRLRGDQIEVFKILNGYENIDRNVFFSLKKDSRTRGHEYCTELYNSQTKGNAAVLDCPMNTEKDNFPILREEVEAAVKSLKKGKSHGIDNISAELIQAGGEAVTNIVTPICIKIWQTGDWPTPRTQSMVITLPKKGNLQLCKNYRTISLINHPSKVMLKVILNRLKPQAEDIMAEEQAGFRAGHSTTEQIFNLRILCEKYLQHQEDLYHVFIDFKKAFDRVWQP